MNDIDCVINITNFRQLLQTNLQTLQDYTNAKNLRSIRLSLTKILEKENQFLAAKSITANYCHEDWLSVVQILITDTSSCSDVISEKQLLLQILIAHEKLSIDNCITLINSFITNSALRRSECVTTLQDIFKNADQIGLDKTSPLVGQCITWLYGDKDRNEAKSILLHIEPIKPHLIAETCAIAVINFLNLTTLKSSSVLLPSINYNLQSLQYKYIRKYLCLEKHANDLKLLQEKGRTTKNTSSVNCLFQSSYEFLMRSLNFETTQGTTCKDILQDLNSLQKMSLLMKALLQYGVFDDNSFMQCPLIKRIGFFLSHMEVLQNLFSKIVSKKFKISFFHDSFNLKIIHQLLWSEQCWGKLLIYWKILWVVSLAM